MLQHYCTLTSIAFDLAIGVVGRCTFSTPSRKSAVTFVLIGIFRQREAASEVTKGALDAMEFLFLVFLHAFAFSGNAKDAVLDCYPNDTVQSDGITRKNFFFN